MKATASTRTATRCCSSSARALAAALLLAANAGCVKSMVPLEYAADPRLERLDPDGARDQLSAQLATECPRLAREGGSPTGEARVTVNVDGNGDVLRSRLTARTEDDRVNALFARTAAQMRFVPPADAQGKPYTGRMRMGYSCAQGAAVGTIELF